MGFPDLPSEVLSQRRRKRMPKGACCWRRILTAPRSRLSPRTSPSPPLRPRQSPNPSHLIKQVWLLLSNPTHLRSLSPLRSSPSVTPSHLKAQPSSTARAVPTPTTSTMMMRPTTPCLKVCDLSHHLVSSHTSCPAPRVSSRAQVQVCVCFARQVVCS